MVESNDLILGPGECSPVEPGSEEEEGYACIVIVKIVCLHTKNAPYLQWASICLCSLLKTTGTQGHFLTVLVMSWDHIVLEVTAALDVKIYYLEFWA